MQMRQKLNSVFFGLALLTTPNIVWAGEELNAEAIAAYQRGDYAASEKLLTDAYNKLSSSKGESHPDTLSVMSSLAFTYFKSGRTTEALLLYEKVLKSRTESLGERHPDTLGTMGNLAAAYDELGRTAEALVLEERVLKLRTETFGEHHPDTLRAMGNLAGTYDDLGRTTKALALEEKVLKQSTEIFGERHPDTLRAMGNLAQTYGSLGRTTEALALKEKVLKLRIEISGERHPDTLTAMGNLAQTYFQLGRIAEALTQFEKVLKLRTEISGERHPNTLTAMGNLSATYGVLGRTAEALDLGEKVLKLRTVIFGERHPNTLTTVSILAAIYNKLGRATDATVLSTPYLNGAEWQRSQPGLSVENRQALFQKFTGGYRFFSDLQATQGNITEGLRIAELSKARTLLESMSAQRANRSGELPAAEQEKLENLNRQVGAFNQLIAQAKSEEAKQNLEAQKNDLVRQYQTLQAQLKAKYPKFAQLSDVKIISVADLPRLIPKDAVAVSYLVSDQKVGAYLVDGTGKLSYVALGKIPNLGDAVEMVRRSQSAEGGLVEAFAEDGKRAWRLKDGSYRLLDATKPAPKDAVAVTDAKEIAQYLSDKLLKPLEAELKSKPRWIISPDGALAQLPFETLPWGAEAKPAIASTDIQYTQSLSVFALSQALQKKHKGLKGRKALFAMGNPQYAQQAMPAAQRRSLSRNAPLVVVEQLKDLDPLWNDLPGTATEIQNVAAIFPKSTSTYLGAQATEQQLQELNQKGELKNYRYLLLSAHGYLSAERPALSSIVLGLRNRTPNADGYVTASEWPSYDLQSDLTVLSACDSGVGKVVGGEGVMGLPFALFVAGNVNTILTLWPVDDQASAEFVRSLFTKLKAGQSATQALANTKREFVKHKEFSHPRFWAPYILVGAG